MGYVSHKYLRWISLWSLLFAAGLLGEIFLNLKGRALCELESCLLVSALAHLSHLQMVLLGLAFFLILVFLSLWYQRTRTGSALLVLTAGLGLGGEAVFLLRQAFDYKVWCPFCLVVAVGVLGASLGILFIFRRWSWSFLGFWVGLVPAFLLTSLTLVPLEKVARPAFPERDPPKNYFLVYSENCPHCHEVLDFCRNLPGFNLYLCPKDQAWGLLRSLDLKGIPVLVVKEKKGIKVYQGSQTIIAFLKDNFKAPAPLLPETPLPGLLVPPSEGVCSELQPRCE